MRWLVVTFVGFAVLAAAVAHLSFSDAAFTSGSSTGVRASTAPLSSNSVRAIAGDAQSAPAGAQVPTPPAVLVTDTGGNPVAGVDVSFAVSGGDGSVSGARATTDETGVATVGSWRLGPAAGANELTATAAGLASPTVTFTATGGAAPAAGYLVTVSDERPVAGSAVTVTAQLMDEHGDAVTTPGVRVTWSKTGPGGSIIRTSTTDPAGRATTTLTTATVAGRTSTVKAASSNPARTGVSPDIVTVAGPPAKLSIGAGNQQSATVGTAVAVTPTVLVRDANNNPVSGAEVAFSVGAGGGQVTGATTVTDEAGRAAVGEWTLGTVAGGNSLSAAVAGLPAMTVTFTAAGSPGPAEGYLVTASTTTPRPGARVIIRAQLADAHGNGIKTSGIAVAWALRGPDADLTSASVTNANGVAVASLITGHAPGTTYAVTASSTSPGAWTGTSAPIVVTP